VPVTPTTELLQQAADKAQNLLQSLQRDQAAVADCKGGARVFKATVDATRNTLDNILRAQQDAASSSSSD
jgi:hypothetical protein